jgi:hypothetical protein
MNMKTDSKIAHRAVAPVVLYIGPVKAKNLGVCTLPSQFLEDNHVLMMVHRIISMPNILVERKESQARANCKAGDK